MCPAGAGAGASLPLEDSPTHRIQCGWFHAEQPCSQPLESTSNTTHSGRRVLHSGGPNQSKPAVFIVFLHLDWANPSYP